MASGWSPIGWKGACNLKDDICLVNGSRKGLGVEGKDDANERSILSQISGGCGKAAKDFPITSGYTIAWLLQLI
jgi:hypothetical protein